MSKVLAAPLISPEDYLEGELRSSVKHEFVGGHVYAMSGGTMAHQRIARNFSRHTGNQLAGKDCEPTNSDFLVRIKADNDEVMYYPDGMIICHSVEDNEQFTESPTVILEVLSPTTRRIDEAQKYRDYLTIPSLQTYILAETESPTLTLYRRKGDSFQREVITGIDATLSLPEVEVDIAFSELFEDVQFDTSS
ncbi:MAG: Uma2 family endonuclease [Akkermansiaceae bacterium]|nr:Uma2 family endonuclease [Akkermansiaceae bacterium]